MVYGLGFGVEGSFRAQGSGLEGGGGVGGGGEGGGGWGGRGGRGWGGVGRVLADPVSQRGYPFEAKKRGGKKGLWGGACSDNLYTSGPRPRRIFRGFEGANSDKKKNLKRRKTQTLNPKPDEPSLKALKA